MSQQFYYDIAAQRGTKLRGELRTAGIPVLQMFAWTEATDDHPTGVLIVVPDDVAESAVDAVVAAHDPEVPSAAEQQVAADTLSMADLAQTYTNMKNGLDTIRTHMTAINNGPASPTAAQTGTALKTLAGDVTTLCNGLDKLLDVLRAFVRREVG